MNLTPAQRQIFYNNSRFRVAACGRRFGKTFLGKSELARAASPVGVSVMAVAPTYKMVKKLLWKPLVADLIDRRWLKHKNESDHEITLVNGSSIIMRSAENYDAMRGLGNHFVLMDECADIAEEAWYEVIRPTLSDHGGGAILMGTPKGRNWFYDLYLKNNDPEWASFQFTTLEGGNVSEEEIRAASRDLDSRTFQQEYCAAFVNYSGVIYYAWNDRVLQPYTHAVPAQIHVGMDFNRDPMSAIVAVQTERGIHLIDEIVIHSSNTHEMVGEIQRRYADKRVICYPDASGSANKTSANGVTDHLILKSAGFRVVSGKTNPPVDFRISSVNSGLEHGGILMDPRCRQMRECLLKQTYKSGTRIPDKSTGHDHLNDALGYLVTHLMPMNRITQNAHAPRRMSTGRMG